MDIDQKLNIGGKKRHGPTDGQKRGLEVKCHYVYHHGLHRQQQRQLG